MSGLILQNPSAISEENNTPISFFAERIVPNIKYSDVLFYKMRESINTFCEKEKNKTICDVLNTKIQLWKELNHFNDLGVFDDTFVDNEFAEWKMNHETCLYDRKQEPPVPCWTAFFFKLVTFQLKPTEKTEEEIKREYVEERLNKLPFEKAYWYKNPEYNCTKREDILQRIFGNSYKSKEQYEYMCYYVINTRDEIAFDIYDILYSVE